MAGFLKENAEAKEARGSFSQAPVAVRKKIQNKAIGDFRNDEPNFINFGSPKILQL